VAVAGLVGMLAACGGGGSGKAAHKGAAASASPVRKGPSPGQPGTIAGLGPRWLARIPADSRQVVVAYGDGPRSPSGKVELWVRQRPGWVVQAGWASHNGRGGWTASHREGDERTPIGVFTLTDAGGLLPDPGAKLPYYHASAFTPLAAWGPSRRHDFDYVIAIDYNRVPGTSPLDGQRPHGQAAGGGIWLHLDHGSGSAACVTVPQTAMVRLLRTLDPAQHPVVVMGDRASLAR
jgi:L,D-peptidoglycan transpeptidase YkuD (ErfK/YbiS/YcfS/YnhG family)